MNDIRKLHALLLAGNTRRNTAELVGSKPTTVAEVARREHPVQTGVRSKRRRKAFYAPKLIGRTIGYDPPPEVLERERDAIKATWDAVERERRWRMSRCLSLADLDAAPIDEGDSQSWTPPVYNVRRLCG